MTGRSVVLLLIAASTLFAARNVGVGWLYALGYALAATVAGSAFFGAWSLWGVRMTVTPGQKTEAGVPLPVAVTLENRGLLSRRYLSLVAGPLGGRGKLWPWRRALVPEGWGSLLIPELKAGDRLSVQLPVPAPQRGIHELPAVYLQAAPLGLVACFKAWKDLRKDGSLMVHPRVHALGPLAWLQRGRGHGEHESALRPEDGGELTKAVRPYRSGDAMRQIHWKTTARTGQLAVRESEGDAPAQELAVLLDASGQSDASFELAIEVVASLLTQARTLGMDARLYHQSGEGQGLGPGVQSLEGQLDWLAALSSASCPPLTGGQGAALGGVGRRSHGVPRDKEPGSRNTPHPAAPGVPPSRGDNQMKIRGVVVTARPDVWAGHAEACVYVGPDTTIEDVLRELT